MSCSNIFLGFINVVHDEEAELVLDYFVTRRVRACGEEE
jgi:hypothetical protein